MQFRKPDPAPLLFVIAAFGVLSGLGVWQVERLQWKNALVVSIEHQQALPPLMALPANTGNLAYRSAELRGTFLYGKTFRFVGGKQDRGQDLGMGFFLVTPFKLDDGRLLLVNRGWSPEGRESKPTGEQTVRGILRPLREKRLFSPENRADKNVWFYEDIPAMAQALGAPLPPVVLEAVGKMEKNTYPIPSDGDLRLRNDHFGYAVTWFSLALIALAMFGAYHRVPGARIDKSPY